MSGTIVNRSHSAIAIIPARGGSRRIPRKNIKVFLGRPVIGYSIDAAKAAACFDRVMVSTDDQEIAAIAASSGADVPFLRSAATATDLSTTADVLAEVLDRYCRQGFTFEYCCCIYPAAPLVTPQRILEGFQLLTSGGADAVVPVVRYRHPIQRALLIAAGRLRPIDPDSIGRRTQDLEPMYHDAGMFYWLRVEPFMGDRLILGGNTAAIELPEREVQDIDTMDDWADAELKYRSVHADHNTGGGGVR